MQEGFAFQWSGKDNQGNMVNVRAGTIGEFQQALNDLFGTDVAFAWIVSRFTPADMPHAVDTTQPAPQPGTPPPAAAPQPAAPAPTAPAQPAAQPVAPAAQQPAQAPICESCGLPKKYVPAGVSKKTNKPYPAFYADCKDGSGKH